ncbi:unnamed protein product, partial [Adineta steineri]
PCALCQEAREIKGREGQLQAAFMRGGGPPVVSQPM